MNILRINLKFGATPDYPEPQLAAEAIIDDQTVIPWTDLPVDLLALRASVAQPGHYFIWTCTCGIPECAGLEAGVAVEHTPATIVWTTAEPPFEEPTRFEFAKAAYEVEIARAWAEYVRTIKGYRAAGISFELCPWLPDTTLQAAMKGPRPA